MGIFVNGSLLNDFQFYGGERNVNVSQALENKNSDIFQPFIETIDIRADLWCSNDIMDLLLTVNAIRRHKAGQAYRINLFIPYLPYARQDRVCNKGEPLSIEVMANLINSLKCDRVGIYDSHSDVAVALIDNVVLIEQHEILMRSLVKDYIKRNNLMVVSPDAGAEKKVRKLIDALNLNSEIKTECLFATKQRNVLTGEIEGVTIHTEPKGRNCIIVDDICDGGRTFIHLAQTLKHFGSDKVYLYVTHGIFSNGFDELKKHLDHIFVANMIPQEYVPDFVTQVE